MQFLADILMASLIIFAAILIVITLFYAATVILPIAIVAGLIGLVVLALREERRRGGD